MFHRPRLPHPRNLTERFANIIMVARYAVGEAQFTKGLDTAIAWVIARYLERVVQRFKRLIARAEAGTLDAPAKPRKPAEGAAGAEPRIRKPRPKPLIRMSGYCWIARHAQGAGAAGNYLRLLIEQDAELIGLIARHRQFAALLRPLLAAFAQVPDPERLPPPPPRARLTDPKPKPPKPPRTPRAKKVTWKCAKPPNYGLEFSDPTLNLWHGK
jgi:hypothetical protein